MHLEAVVESSQDRDASGMPQLQGRIHITVYKHTLNRKFTWLIVGDQLGNTQMDLAQPVGEGFMLRPDTAI